jgi:hypothetical protein
MPPKPKLDNEDKLEPDSRSILLSIISLFSPLLVPKCGIPLYSLFNRGIGSMKGQLNRSLSPPHSTIRLEISPYVLVFGVSFLLVWSLIIMGIKRSILREREEGKRWCVK